MLSKTYEAIPVSLVGADFSTFTPMSVNTPGTKTTAYDDRFGLRYVVYAEDDPDGRFHLGDMKQIVYGASGEETTKLTSKP